MNEHLAIRGKIVELEKQAARLKTKIRGAVEIVRENCCLALKDSYEQIDDQLIEVFAVELAQDIRSLRDISDRIRRLYEEIGEARK